MSEKRRYIILYLIFALCFIAALISGIALGSVSLSLSEVFRGLLSESGTEHVIVFGLRLPRVLGACLAGACLACAGLILQCVTSNPLCAPNIVGINAGAGFCVMVMLCLFPAYWRLLPLGAFLGALCTTLTITAIAFSSRREHGRHTLVLAGVAVSSILNAGISFLSLKYPDVLSSYAAFSAGGFSDTRLDRISIPFFIFLVCFGAAFVMSPKLNLLCLGDESAKALGVNVSFLRIFSLIVASAMCASAVSFAGLLGFVGLIVPHIVRKLSGSDIRANLGLCALLGAALTCTADLVGRTVFSPSELPAGIITALIGAPFFLYLLTFGRNSLDKM